MPSVTDIQQQTSKISLNNNGKSTPPPASQQAMTTDSSSTDPITQVVQALEKKQRNLGKRKDKLESYDQAAKSGKELNADQKDALAKYAEVIGQIECVKDLSEQVKKIQTDMTKNQKRLNKQAAEEKRMLVAQRLREYAQLRYLLDHRPNSLKSEESALLDELARVLIPSEASSSTITRAVDTILGIYQSGPSSVIKTLPGRSSQEVRESLEQIIKQLETPSTEETVLPQFPEPIEQQQQTPVVSQPPPPTPASVLPQREQSNTNDALSHTHLLATHSNEHPLQFDTREQNISYQQLMQDSPFILPLEPTNNNQQESSNQQENTQIQSTDPNQYLQPFTALNSNLSGQSSSQDYTQTSAESAQRAAVGNYDQESSSHMQTDDQQSEEQWQHRRGNSGNANRGGQYNRGSSNNYNQQQWRGPRGGHYDNSYGGGQRQYGENNNRGRGGPNPNYRGNRGGNYRGGNRGSNGNGYPRSSQYQQQSEQMQTRSAPSNQQY